MKGSTKNGITSPTPPSTYFAPVIQVITECYYERLGPFGGAQMLGTLAAERRGFSLF